MLRPAGMAKPVYVSKEIINQAMTLRDPTITSQYVLVSAHKKLYKNQYGVQQGLGGWQAWRGDAGSELPQGAVAGTTEQGVTQGTAAPRTGSHKITSAGPCYFLSRVQDSMDSRHLARRQDKQQ